MLILVSGLPRAGKSSFAHAAESLQDGYTHVPLDKYILEVPEGLSFLAWVASPQWSIGRSSKPTSSVWRTVSPVLRLHPTGITAASEKVPEGRKQVGD
jgi:chloramphenicol 3-O-phosphotransferase